ATKVSGRREDTVVMPRGEAHPVISGLPDQFEHAYYDHLLLEPGPDGTVLVSDRSDAPVVVVGEAGAGRVVLNGMIPGYWYDPATYAQGEKRPSGAELQLVVNALTWAGAARVSQRPEDEIAQAREQLEQEMEVEEMRRLLPDEEWFGGEMLQGSYLPRPPVTQLGGRFFITYDSMTWRGYEMRGAQTEEELAFFRSRLRMDVLQLKWLGVTDIIYWTDVSGERVYHNTDVPDSSVRYPHFDPLGMLVEIAEEEGMRVWAGWHSCARSEEFAETYCAKDAEGNLYKYGTRSYVEDLLSPAWRERVHRLIDEYADRYGDSESFQGIGAYDELWFTYADFHEDDLPRFGQFCREQFGEAPPEDMAQRLALHRQWDDTDDVWRRRYILFKQQVITDYVRDLIDYCHSRGLKYGLEVLATAHYSSGWCWGMDSVRLARLGADLFVCSPRTSAEAYYPGTVRWAHAHDGWGLYNTHCFRGESPGGTYFTFNQLWRLIMYGNNPDLPHQLARHITNQRRWANAQSLARVALLHHQNALQMLLADPRPAVNGEQAIVRTISRHQPVEVVFTRATELHDRYRVLVAAPYSVRGLAPEVMDRLRGFVQAGGTIISLGAHWSTSRPDLTGEQDLTSEMVGVSHAEAGEEAPAAMVAGERRVPLALEAPPRRAEAAGGTEVLARFEPGGAPAVTRRALGEGQVIGVHLDVGALLERGESPELAQWLSELVRESSSPEVFAEGEGFRVMSALRKGDWIGVALFPDEVPSVATLHVDAPALGIDRGGFRMLMLGKEMEITLPGDRWGEEGFWPPEMLAEGFPVTICEDNDRVMPLPEEFDLSAFDEDEASYIDSVTRGNWSSVSEGQEKRTYAHEIVVLAPGDEPTMPR
ncbi:MAG: hypothetical protein U9R79_09805, partial [Armatimonadota bacterium]|nr:hypothetical protein [Armatimonadota bacterium]